MPEVREVAVTGLAVRAASLPVPAGGRALIVGLRGSSTHRLSVEVYLLHRDAGEGVCGRCGHRVPCPACRHAVTVIEAAGEDPRLYDKQSAVGTADVPAAPDGVQHSRPDRRMVGEGVSGEVIGFHLGGVGRRADVPYFGYER